MNEGIFTLDPEMSLVDEETGRFDRASYQKYRPTISCLVIVRDRVLVVQSSKDPTSRTWLPPQGSIERGVSFYQALRELLWQELGKDVTDQALRQQEANKSLLKIGAYVNTQRDNSRPKYMVCTALRLDSDQIKLNQDNKKFKFIFGQYELWHQMAGTRTVKVLGTCHMVNGAEKAGLLTWRCDDVIDQFLMVA